jgi:sterol carrier protein 2
VPSDIVGKINGLGYNPAVEAKGFTAEQAKSVVSKTHSSQYALNDTQERVLARF